MSLKSHAMRSLVATGAVAFASFGVATPANAAINAKLVYQCKFPIIAPGTISMDIQGPDIPDRWPIGEPTPEWLITTKATLNAPIPKAMSSIKGLASIEGVPGGVVADASLKLSRADGEFDVPAVVDLSVDKIAFTPTSDATKTLDVIAKGSAPSQYQDDPATGKIVLNSIALNFIARDNTGAALKLAPVTRDWANQPISDSDNNPETFDVICRLDPNTPNQSLELANIEFFDPNVTPVGSAPTTPTEGVTVPATDSLDITWGASTDADNDLKGYNVSVQELDANLDPVGAPKTSFVNAPATNTKITGLKAATAYDVTITAEDQKGKKSEGLLLQLDTLGNEPIAPTAPANLKGTGALTSVDLTWDAAVDADGTVKEYRVYQDGGATPVKTVTTTSAKIEGLTSDKAYKFKVIAVDNTDLAGPASDEITVSTTKPAENQAPSKVANVSGTGALTSVSLKWDAATDADGSVKEYRVYQDGAAAPVKTVTGTTAEITGLASDTEFSFTVVAVDDKDKAGAASDAVKVKTLKPVVENQAPSKVANVSGTGALTSVSLKWDAATDADGSVKEYRVYQDGAAAPVKTVTGTTAEITGLASDTEFSFTVVAVDDKDKAGAASDAVKVKTLKPVVENQAPSKVAGVSGTATANAVALKWGAATDSDGTVKEYRVFQNGGANPVKTVTGTSVDIGGLAAETEYTFTVVAVDDKGKAGAASDAYKITTLKGEQPNEQAPVVSSVIGRTAFANIGGVALVSGKNLSKIQKVTVGTKNASYSSLGSTLALVVLPPLKKGSYDLTITTAGGTSNATKITYISLW